VPDDAARNKRSAASARKAPGHLVLVTLDDEQYAAMEGWRAARGIADQPEAIGELVRIGLLSEIARIYRFVNEVRQDASRPRVGERPARRGSRADGKTLG